MGIFDLIGIMKVLMVVNHTCMHVYGFLVSSEIKCFAKKVTSISSKKEVGLEIGLISCSIDSRFKEDSEDCISECDCLKSLSAAHIILIATFTKSG